MYGQYIVFFFTVLHLDPDREYLYSSSIFSFSTIIIIIIIIVIIIIIIIIIITIVIIISFSLASTPPLSSFLSYLTIQSHQFPFLIPLPLHLFILLYCYLSIFFFLSQRVSSHYQPQLMFRPLAVLPHLLRSSPPSRRLVFLTFLDLPPDHFD